MAMSTADKAKLEAMRERLGKESAEDRQVRLEAMREQLEKEAVDDEERFKKWREGVTELEGSEGRSENWWRKQFRQFEKSKF
jgi:hypothetical protein